MLMYFSNLWKLIVYLYDIWMRNGEKYGGF
jgi:hypothetical protein